MYHVTVDQMRLIEWARTYNWAVRFPDGQTPEEFRSWFPATDVNYSMESLQGMNFTGSYRDFSIPEKKGERRVSITLVDGAKMPKNYDYSERAHQGVNVLQLHDWAQTWYKNIHYETGGVQTLSEACRRLDVIHYDPMSNIIVQYSWAVFPDGEIEFTGDSEGGSPQQLSLDLVIAGYIPVRPTMLGGPSGRAPTTLLSAHSNTPVNITP